MADQFAVRLELPWAEPIGLAPPTKAQWASGLVVIMKVDMCGNATHRTGEMYLMDAPQATRLLEAGYARRETEQEIACAKAVGHQRGPKLTGHPAVDGEAKAKPKKKAKSKPKKTEASDAKG